MNYNNTNKEDAVSPVVGVILMVAILYKFFNEFV